MVAEKIKTPNFLTVIVGILAIISASGFSYLIHQFAHIEAAEYFCNSNLSLMKGVLNVHNDCILDHNCVMSVLAGPFSNIFLTIISLWILTKFPYNHFITSLALINASARIGEGFILLLQMLLFRYNPTIVNDERYVLGFINFPDMSSALVILFFYILFFGVMIIIGIRTFAWKGWWKWVFVSAAIILQIPLNALFQKYFYLLYG
ncbi:MAG: hypothetical protein Q8K98_03930 [Bacteroidota bacterium]|nr:hypothetical protein [Bacteroidota bacterium]